MGCERAEHDADGKPLTLSVRVQHWPIRGHFTIARGSKREAAVVLAELSDGTATGRGECVPYARYGGSVDGVVLVCMAKTTSRGVLLRAREQIEYVNGRIFGAVLNAAQMSRGGYFREQMRSFYDYQAEEALAGSTAPALPRDENADTAPEDSGSYPFASGDEARGPDTT